MDLRFWHFWGAATWPAIEPMIAEFEAAHPGIHITPEYQGNYDLLSRKLLASIVAGDPPEVFTLGSADVPRFAEAEGIVPLEISIEDQADFFPAVLSAFTSEGKLWALPVEGATYALFWNRALFREARLPDRAPQSWDELIQFGRALTRDTDGDGEVDQWGFARHDPEYVGGSTIFNLYFSNRAEIPPQGNMVLDTPALRDSLTLWADLERVHGIAPRCLPAGAIPRGKVGMWIGGTFSIPALRSVLDLGLAPIPPCKDPVTLSAPDVLVAGKTDPAREAAARQFIRWLTSPDQQLRLCQKLDYLPLRESVLAHPDYRRFLDDNPLFRPIADAMKRFRTKPARPDWPLIQDALNAARESVEQGRAEPAAALYEAQRRLDEALARAGAMRATSGAAPRMWLTVVGLLAAGVCFVLARHVWSGVVRRPSKGELAAALFILPQVLFFLAFTLIPLGAAVLISLHHWDMLHPAVFAGFANYRQLFAGEAFHEALRRTGLWLLLTVPANTIIALGVACLLNARPRMKHTGSMLFFVPNITSAVAITLLWWWLLPGEWLADPRRALLGLATMEWWRALGGFLVYLAALQAVPIQRYEAAVMDGAHAWARFRHVTWPALRPVTFFMLATFSIDAFQTFDSIYVMTEGEGGPDGSTTTLAFLLYKTAFVQFEMGEACALAFISAGLLLGLIAL